MLKLVAVKQAITIKWAKLMDVTGYDVFMATSENGAFTKIHSSDSSSFSYTKTGLISGNTYYFKVVAYTTSGTTTIYGEFTGTLSEKVK